MAQLFKSIQESTSLKSEMEHKGITFQDMISYFENEKILEEEEVTIDPGKIESIDDIADYFAMANLTNTQLDASSMNSLATGLTDKRNRKSSVHEVMKGLVNKQSIRKDSLKAQ